MASIILAGHTPVNRRRTVELLTKNLSSMPEVHFIVPLEGTADSDVPPLFVYALAALDAVEATGLVTIIVPHGSPAPGADSYLAEMAIASRCTQTRDPLAKAVDLLTSPSEDLILLAWDDEDPECERAVVLGCAGGYSVLDVTSNLERLEVDPEPEDAQTLPSVHPEPVEPLVATLETDQGVLADTVESLVQALTNVVLSRVLTAIKGMTAS